MSAEADELRERAGRLNDLADDVESLLSGAGKPKSFVDQSMGNWQGPNRDDVSGQLDDYNSTCINVAGQLRTLANDLGRQADDAENQENPE